MALAITSPCRNNSCIAKAVRFLLQGKRQSLSAPPKRLRHLPCLSQPCLAVQEKWLVLTLASPATGQATHPWTLRAKQQPPPAPGQRGPLVPCFGHAGDRHIHTGSEGNTYIHSEYLLLFPKCKHNEKKEKGLIEEQTYIHHVDKHKHVQLL